jgi:hypothetical protein
MKTPRDKYHNDPQFNSLVNLLESFIYSAQFTPSELREACVMASINYEMKHIGTLRFEIDRSVASAFNIIESYLDNPQTKS